jgi:hypothetical protein
MFGWLRKRRESNRPGDTFPAAIMVKDQLAFYRNHPPRCVAGFKAQPVEMPNVTFDGHASVSPLDTEGSGTKIEGCEHVNPVFRLFCTCGCDSHFVIGYNWHNPDCNNEAVFLSPLSLRCSDCGKVTVLFDSDIHGYDAEACSMSTCCRAEGERAEFACDRCGPRQAQVFVRFEYPDDLLGPEFDKYRGREQDLFSWFTLVGKCSGCGRFIEVADFECA